MEEAPALIAQQVADLLLKQAAMTMDETIFDILGPGFFLERPKATRRQRLRYRLIEYRYRISLAADALRGRHECNW